MLTLFRDSANAVCPHCGSNESKPAENLPRRRPAVLLKPYRDCRACGLRYEPGGSQPQRLVASLAGLWLLFSTTGLTIGAVDGIFGPLGIVLAVPFGWAGWALLMALRRTQAEPGSRPEHD